MKETEGHAEAVKQLLVEAVEHIDERALAEELLLWVPLGGQGLGVAELPFFV